MDINYTYCGDHLAIFINIKLLYWTPKTNRLYIKYTSILKKAKCYF